MKPAYLKSLATALALTFAFLSAPAQQSAQHKTLRIAAASDLTPVMPAIAYAYEKETGTHLEVSFGSSSILATQILNGAPVDVFLGADFTFPEKIIAANLAEEKLPVTYARGTLVLWARKDFAADPTIDILSDPRVTRIAIADQFHAPFGHAAYQELTRAKLLDKLKPKLVVGENIAQTAQFVQSGNAQIGFISLTLALSDTMKAQGKFLRIPDLYDQLQQCAVILKSSKDLAESHKFLDWLRSGPVQEKLPQFGLEPSR